jgi:ATP-dependent DNA ligase
MLAKRVEALPEGDGWIFEPKWDGFRALVFRDGNEVFLQSRDERPLARYYPELLAPIRAQTPKRCVLDGEIVIVSGKALDFEALQMRLHPAASRVEKLSRETPASMVFFDMLCLGSSDLRSKPFEERRAALERALGDAEPPLHVTPATRDRRVAADWFRRFEGAGLDGVIAKPASLAYLPGKRAMLKIKHERDCDCVVAGFRWHKDARGSAVGSLLLGLYDDRGKLQHVGVCASFPMEKRRELVKFLAPYRATLEKHPWREWAGVDAADPAASARDPAAGAPEPAASAPGPARMPGAQSRWSQGKDLRWEPLKPVLVLEVAYDHMQGSRFRHMAQFRRWRPDKKPRDCTFEQLEVVPPHELAKIFGEARRGSLGAERASGRPLSDRPASRLSAPPASGRRRGRASPDAGASPEGRAADSRARASSSSSDRASSRRARRRPRDASPPRGASSSTARAPRARRRGPAT